MHDDLARLMYIGDVPVSATGAGSVLLYRLFQKYPADRLTVVECNTTASEPPLRLPGVSYHAMSTAIRKFGRLARYYCYWNHWMGSSYWKRFESLRRAFRPQAIATVSHGYSWLAAAALAEAYRLPLHLFCHDHWPTMAGASPRFQRWVDEDFGRVYAQAAQRYCVSSCMAERYHERYGVRGKVLFPTRSPETLEFEEPPERIRRGLKSARIVYAGMAYLPYLKMLGDFAACVESLGDEVHIYCYNVLNKETARRSGLDRANVRILPAIPADEVIGHLREAADVLVLPLSFEADLRTNMQLNFPSKLTEYTATGLPIIIWGPPDSSAVRWAKENPGAAAVVDREQARLIREAVSEIKGDADLRYRLGAAALEAGKSYFSYSTAERVLYGGLHRQSPQARSATADWFSVNDAS